MAYHLVRIRPLIPVMRADEDDFHGRMSQGKLQRRGPQRNDEVRAENLDLPHPFNPVHSRRSVVEQRPLGRLTHAGRQNPRIEHAADRDPDTALQRITAAVLVTLLVKQRVTPRQQQANEVGACQDVEDKPAYR